MGMSNKPMSFEELEEEVVVTEIDSESTLNGETVKNVIDALDSLAETTPEVVA